VGAAVGLLLLPIVVLVATVPVWAERRHTATVAAREAVRVLVRDWPNGDRIARWSSPARLPTPTASTRELRREACTCRAGRLRARRPARVPSVEGVTMPAISVTWGCPPAWHYTAGPGSATIDDPRSR
jgi:hypothetical protein